MRAEIVINMVIPGCLICLSGCSPAGWEYRPTTTLVLLNMDMDWLSGYSQRSGFGLLSFSSCSGQARGFLTGKPRQHHSHDLHNPFPFSLTSLDFPCTFLSSTSHLASKESLITLLSWSQFRYFFMQIQYFSYHYPEILSFICYYWYNYTCAVDRSRWYPLESSQCSPPDISGVWWINFHLTTCEILLSFMAQSVNFVSLSHCYLLCSSFSYVTSYSFQCSVQLVQSHVGS